MFFVAFSQLQKMESIEPIEKMYAPKMLELSSDTSILNYGNGFLYNNPSLLINNKANILKSFNTDYGIAKCIGIDCPLNYLTIPTNKFYLPTDTYIYVTPEYYSSRISNIFIGVALDVLFDNYSNKRTTNPINWEK